jgi:hypothetical protein
MAANKITVRCIHDLKTWPTFFQAILDGSKTFELRLDDRGYQVGDVLHLREFDNNRQLYSGRWIRRLVSYKMGSASFSGIEKGYCIMGIGILPPEIKVEIANVPTTNKAQKPGKRSK